MDDEALTEKRVSELVDYVGLSDSWDLGIKTKKELLEEFEDEKYKLWEAKVNLELGMTEEGYSAVENSILKKRLKVIAEELNELLPEEELEKIPASKLVDVAYYSLVSELADKVKTLTDFNVNEKELEAFKSELENRILLKQYVKDKDAWDLEELDEEDFKDIIIQTAEIMGIDTHEEKESLLEKLIDPAVAPIKYLADAIKGRFGSNVALPYLVSGFIPGGSFVDRGMVYKEQHKKKRNLGKIIFAALATGLTLTSAYAATTIHPTINHSGVWVKTGSDDQVLQNWTHYVFHMDNANYTQNQSAAALFGLNNTPGQFQGAWTPLFRNQTIAEFLSTLVNNYTGFFNNKTGGGHWLLKEAIAGAVNATDIITAYKIYLLHPELNNSMDFLLMLGQTKNFQDGLNNTDKQILNNEVNSWEAINQDFQKLLLEYPVNATIYTKTPGDLAYQLFSHDASVLGIDPSNVTQAKILWSYQAVFDGYYAIKLAQNASAQTQFLDNYIIKQAQAIGVDYLKLIAGMKMGVLGIIFKINPVDVQISSGIYPNEDLTQNLNGPTYEKGFIWVNETPRGFPNALADAEALWNEYNLNDTVIGTSTKNKVGSKDSNNPIDALFGWVANRLNNGSGSDDPGPHSFNQLYMTRYLNLTNGVKMSADCSTITPIVQYLIKGQNYIFVKKDNTLTTNPHDPDVIGPLVSNDVVVNDHIGSYAIGWNTTLKEFGFANSQSVSAITSPNGGYPYEYTTFVPTYPRYMERKDSYAGTQYINIPGNLDPPYNNRDYIIMIYNITPIKPIARENIGAMIDNMYNSEYGWFKTDPYQKFYLTGNQFEPIYRAIPVDKPVSGEPTVPEFNIIGLVPMVLIPAYLIKRKKKFSS